MPTYAYIPEDRGKRRKKRFYIVVAASLAAVYVIVIGVGLLMFRAPIFDIQKIEIIGNEEIPGERILGVIRSAAISGSAIKAFLGIDSMLVLPDRLSAESMVFLPEARSVEIEKNYRSRSVEVKVSERESRGIWCFVNSPNEKLTKANNNLTFGNDLISLEGNLSDLACWWFDGEGILFKRGIYAQGSLIISVTDYSQDGIGLGKKFLPEALLGNAFSVFRVLRASGFGIKEIRLNDIALEELEVSIFGGPELFFGLRFPANGALEVLQSFSEKSGFKDLEYIDFRVENRVYYR